MGAIAQAAAKGAGGGLAGVLAMTGAEKLEQGLTGRPSSYVPGRTLAHLLGLEDASEDRLGRNLAMHYGAGVLVGALRGVMAAANLRGPWASLMHAEVRLTTDQTLENLAGVGAPPWTWPRDELVVDVLHKTVYALVTGAVADALVDPLPRSSARRRLWGPRRKGHA